MPAYLSNRHDLPNSAALTKSGRKEMGKIEDALPIVVAPFPRRSRDERTAFAFHPFGSARRHDNPRL
jgi:hypothetical protein